MGYELKNTIYCHILSLILENLFQYNNILQTNMFESFNLIGSRCDQKVVYILILEENM